MKHTTQITEVIVKPEAPSEENPEIWISLADDGNSVMVTQPWDSPAMEDGVRITRENFEVVFDAIEEMLCPIARP